MYRDILFLFNVGFRMFDFGFFGVGGGTRDTRAPAKEADSTV